MKTAQMDATRAVVRYNSRHRLLRLWRPAGMGGAHLAASLEVLLVAVGRYQARQLLLNMQQLPPISPDMQTWLQTNWLPRLRQTELRRLAVLLPAEVYNRMVVEGLLLASAHRVLPYEVQYFSELSATLDWLMNAELPSKEQDWRLFRQTPALVRCRRLRWSRQSA
ncbi:hypothetical protein [Hymenobacter sp. UYP22]|uniref:hypothetical protein n=1 Tax=Hymenobacter sp. UYP22 TaxID=3156348 RepID=UPI00339A3A7F